MALQAEEDETCGGCGQPVAESMLSANEGRYAARLVTCHACAELDKFTRDIEAGDPVEPGVRIQVVKV